jgi:hypothetical protein
LGTLGALLAGPALMNTVAPPPPTTHLTWLSLLLALARTHPGGTGGAPEIKARTCPFLVSTTIVHRPMWSA